MKKWNIYTIFLLTVTLLMATGADALAQRGRGIARQGTLNRSSEMGWVCPAIPGLTEEQREEMATLRTAHLKEMQKFRDQIDINRIRYRSMMREDNANMADINGNIEERSEIRTNMEKAHAAHLQEVRALLTEEQRVWFNSARGAAVRGMRQGVPGGRGARGAGIMRNQPPFGRGL